MGILKSLDRMDYIFCGARYRDEYSAARVRFHQIYEQQLIHHTKRSQPLMAAFEQQAAVFPGKRR